MRRFRPHGNDSPRRSKGLHNGSCPMAVGFDESVPLYSVEAEMSTLGAMLLSERAAEEIVTILNDDDFYRPAHRLVFRAMKALISGHKPIDMVTLIEELKVARRSRERRRPGLSHRDRSLRPQRREQRELCPDRARQGDPAPAGGRRGARSSGWSTTPETTLVQEKVDRAEQLIFEVGRKQLGKYFEPVSKPSRRSSSWTSTTDSWRPASPCRA